MRLVNLVVVGSVLGLVVTRPALAAPTLSVATDAGKSQWSTTDVKAGESLCVGAVVDAAPPADATAVALTKLNDPKPAEVVGTTSLPKADWKNAGPFCVPAEQAGDYAFAYVNANKVIRALGPKVTVSYAKVGADAAADDSNDGGKVKADAVKAAMEAAAVAVKASGRKHEAHRSALTGAAVVTLYFWPNGEPIEALPGDLTERDEIHLVIFVPEDAVATSLSVTACPDRDPFRTQGTFTDTQNWTAAHAKAKITIKEQALPNLTCGAGQVSFTIKSSFSSTDGTTSSLRLSPVYWGTFGIQFTFDLTKDGALGLQKNDAGQSVIQRNTDYLGPKIVPVFIWHPVGLSYDHASWLGTLVNPTLGFDLDAITTSFYIGDSMCGWGLCLAAGAHLRKVDKVPAARTLKEGDVFDDSKSTLPTEKRWGKPSEGGVGFYFGLTVDVNTAAKLFGGDDKK